MIDYLVPTAPFDLQEMLRRPLSRPSKVTVIDVMECSYTRAVRLSTRVIPVTAVGEGTVDSPLLRLTYPDDLSEDERIQVQERMARIFSTRAHLQEFYLKMAPLPQWAVLMNQLYGLRPIQDANLFESMVKVIIGQQLNVKFAATLTERLVDFGGETVNWNGRLLPVFPSAHRVSGWSYDDLRALSFSQRKAEYVIDFARTVASGGVDLEALWKMPDIQIHEVLLPLRGIGPWTVECFLLFGMGRRDIVPAADIGVQNAIRKLYGMEQRPTEEEVRHLAEEWVPWRSYATYYLWQSLIQRQ